MQLKFKKILSSFKNAKVFVVGDLILDCFVWGKVRRISPEAPVPVVEVERDSFVPGGAANVAHNMCALGAKVWLAGIVGKDDEGKRLLTQLKERGMMTETIRVDSSRSTSLKTRVVAHHQQVVRIDREVLSELKEDYLKKILNDFKRLSPSMDALVIEDYGKGVVTQALVSQLILIAKDRSIPVAVDPKKGHLLDYQGISFTTPNLEEAAYFAGVEDGKEVSVEEIGKILLEKWQCQAVLVTLGEKGMCLFEKDKNPYFIPTQAREVYDVSGAGDTVIGTFVLSVIGGAHFKEAAQLANLSAGIVVGKLGTAVVFKDEIEKELDNVR
ncbi:MAG: D-glycero-beta-D-manno-heptose-7-phosphate kinase [Chlamydiae bacterium]|nr:D-glycero-beta-D-manno-heptose-7-phosphate kinase [Chlamydiota bacterium]MBI3277476.1 D-glycero-beta-D-manno-heptose-7-phosphate kinase [Chlamydiota bacterium]